MVEEFKDCQFTDIENTLENCNRRRRIMEVKFSFRRKKKSRMDCDCGKEEGAQQEKLRENSTRIRKKKDENFQQKSASTQIMKEERSRGILAKLFPFRKGRRKSNIAHKNGELKPVVKCKSSDCLDSSEECISTRTSYKNGLVEDERLGQNTDSKRRTNQSNVSKSNKSRHPNSSISSPNLACVEWTSFESVGDSEVGGKRGSLRRSRASLVFPVSEIGSTVFGSLKEAASERYIQSPADVNSITHKQSCLSFDSTSNSESHHEGKQSFQAKNNVVQNGSLLRTSDGRSPHPGKRHPRFHTFSSPDILEESDEKSLIFETNSSLVNIHYNEENVDERPRFSEFHVKSDTSLAGNEKRQDFVFLPVKKYTTPITENKKLARFVSCPGIMETDQATENVNSNLFVKARLGEKDSKPYSPHRRPFSLHEVEFSSNTMEEMDVSLDADFDEDAASELDLPPENHINLPSKELPLAFAEALWDHSADLKTELSFRAGETIAVYFMNNQNWWWGTIDNNRGWFPSSNVRLRVDQELDNVQRQDEITASSLTIPGVAFARRNTFSLLGLQATLRTESEVRSRCVQELLTSERDYLKTLRDVTEGYLKQSKKRSDMFKADDVTVIFCNIEQIYKFHKRFYQEMQKRMENKDMYKSQVGQLFISQENEKLEVLKVNTKGFIFSCTTTKSSDEFNIYSEYCNNHPNACARLLELQQEKRYRLFFESCRLLQQMISLAIDAFLLTPIQKICKYPLQLNELLKHTPPDHPDHEPLQAAVQVMRDVASSINERKRKVENLSSIAEWQLGVEAWQGEDILENSCEKMKCGVVENLFGGKKEDVHLHLFDHQLIICKRDSFKKTDKLVYNKRVNLDHARFDLINDQSGTGTQNLIRLTDFVDDVTHWFSTKTVDETDSWLSALRKERQIVKSEENTGYSIPKSIKQAAMEAARTKKQTESKKGHRRRKSMTDPFQGLGIKESFEFGTNVIRRSLRLRRTQSLRDKKSKS